VLREEEVSVGSGARQMAIIMKSADLHKALGESEVVSLLGAS
jgi:prolyl-tRNA editing enzyme YbaK/EbsC (Cys-tRNA(Pro) deacylase)